MLLYAAALSQTIYQAPQGHGSTARKYLFPALPVFYLMRRGDICVLLTVNTQGLKKWTGSTVTSASRGGGRCLPCPAVATSAAKRALNPVRQLYSIRLLGSFSFLHFIIL